MLRLYHTCQQGYEWFDNSPNGALGVCELDFDRQYIVIERDLCLKYGKKQMIARIRKFILIQSIQTSSI